jgi:hypothetical protein
MKYGGDDSVENFRRFLIIIEGVSYFLEQNELKRLENKQTNKQTRIHTHRSDIN